MMSAGPPRIRRGTRRWRNTRTPPRPASRTRRWTPRCWRCSPRPTQTRRGPRGALRSACWGRPGRRPGGTRGDAWIPQDASTRTPRASARGALGAGTATARSDDGCDCAATASAPRSGGRPRQIRTGRWRTSSSWDGRWRGPTLASPTLRWGGGGPLPMECSLDHACFQRFVLVLALAGACQSVDGGGGQSTVLHCRL